MRISGLSLVCAVGLISVAGCALAQADNLGAMSQDEIVVAAKRLDSARGDLLPSLGASNYVIDRESIANEPQGVDTSFAQVLLQAPGVSQDGFGQLHVRNEHAGLQYRINGIMLPEGVSGFGQLVDPRIIDSVDLITGSLPAQYGYRTAGVVDITTKSGVSDHGETIGLYGGSRATFEPSFQASGANDGFNYYLSGSYLRDDAGLESPTGSANPIHDFTQQVRGFAYLSDMLSPDTRVSAMLGTSIGFFEIPNDPNRMPLFSTYGQSFFNPADLNQSQREVDHYAIVALQGSVGDIDYQVAPFTRYSEIKFTPDPVGNLIFNGFADRTLMSSWSSGVQGDVSYRLSDSHTLHVGTFFSGEHSISELTSDALPVGPGGTQSSDIPLRLYDQNGKTGYLYGLYVEDEWAVTGSVTLDFGTRFDVVDAFTHENQISPRVNLVWKPDDDTTVHAGYARDFTPPPQALVAPSGLGQFLGTTKAPAAFENSPVRAEREHYFDVGALRTVIPGLDLGLDAYYKIKRNLLDEGQFGEALTLTPFNYRYGRAYGIEATGSYHNGPLGAYANVAYGEEKGEDIASGQFLFTPEELAYIRDHAIYTDHAQAWTISGGASLEFSDSFGRLRTNLDLIFGSGARGSPLNALEPNGVGLPSYTQVNLGLAQEIESSGVLSGVTVRFDIVNLFDERYELRNGTGVGVGPPQFGFRRAFYAGISKNM